MSEQGAKPEVLPGDLITRPGLYEARCGHIVKITGWRDGWWVSEWNGIRNHYSSDGRQRYDEGQEPNQWQLLHWVGPLPATEPEPATTTEQLAEIEGQPEPVQVCEGRWRTRGGDIRNVTPTPECDNRHDRFPWRDTAYDQTWTVDGRCKFNGEDSPLDLVKCLGPIEPQPEPQPVPEKLPEGCRNDGGWSSVSGTEPEPWPEPRPEPQPEPVKVREGRWKTRNGDIRSVTPTPEGDGREHSFPWWDAQYRQTWTSDGRYYTRSESPLDLVECLGPIEQQPESQAEPEPESDAELRIRLLKQANNNQAETIGQLKGEARDLNMEIGGLERRLSERDARIRDLETMHAAAVQAVVDAGKQNDALRAQVQNRQQEYERQKGRIEFLETLNAGNGAAINGYKTQIAKLLGSVDTARDQLEAAATERDELRAAIDAADKQLDQKDAQIRDLRIELEAAQQVQHPVSDEERERIWDEATEQAGRQVMRWLRPMIAALNKQPNERFQRFMALTLSVLPDLLPELLGYAVEDEADCEE